MSRQFTWISQSIYHVIAANIHVYCDAVDCVEALHSNVRQKLAIPIQIFELVESKFILYMTEAKI